jgi:hypothetical protein
MVFSLEHDIKVTKNHQNLLPTQSVLVAHTVVRCDQLKNKSSRRVTYGNPCYSIGSKANSIYFLNDRSVLILKNEFYKG